MARPQRQKLIEQIQAKRNGRLLVAYVTSTRTNQEVQIADDVLPLLYEHLELSKESAEKNGVDLFLHSNGGSGTVPWRIVCLIREYTNKFSVIVPHRAFSAATLIALGANEIIMHRMGCLGPIDPSVANIFNPPHPANPAMQAPISVEDVTAFFKLIQEIGISHEDQLVQAVTALTDKIHPLALGNVQRSHNQARMLARKLLKKHMTGPSKEHEIDQLIDTLKSNLFFHGHPINRLEAKNDLHLKIAPPNLDLEKLMWQLYLEYDKELKMSEPFNPLHELEAATPAAPAQPPAPAQVPAPLQIPPNIQLPMPMHPQALVPQATRKVKLDGLRGAFVQSAQQSHVFLTDLTIERGMMMTPAGPQDAFKQEVRWQRWEQEP